MLALFSNSHLLRTGKGYVQCNGRYSATSRVQKTSMQPAVLSGNNEIRTSILSLLSFRIRVNTLFLYTCFALRSFRILQRLSPFS